MAILAVRGLTVQFPAVRALDDVSLAFDLGQVHGIIGENGAGKSTLMRCMAGLQQPTDGSIEVDGKPVHFRSPREAANHGIAMIHQELNLVDSLSVAANIFLGAELGSPVLIDDKAMEARAEGLLARVAATISPKSLVKDLSLAQKQLVEIAKALGQDARVLIMDEPTAVLSENETQNLFRLVQELRTQGVCVLYISHRLVELELLCDHITVLRDGKHVGTFERGQLSQAELANKMVGRELSDVFPERKPIPVGDPILAAESIADSGRVRSASFSIRRGEILGLAGLMGAGRTEIGQLLAGHTRLRSGTIHWKGTPVSIRSAAHALKLGIAYVSEDRKEAGLHTSLNLIENVSAANLGKQSPVWIRDAELGKAAQKWIRELDIRVGNPYAPVRQLSGGNQQKVSVAKWLDTQPELLILDEPTRGVDVGAKGELYKLIHQWAESGLACLVISSELPELLGLCHRILVVREGTIVAEFEGASATEELIMHEAAGARV